MRVILNNNIIYLHIRYDKGKFDRKTNTQSRGSKVHIYGHHGSRAARASSICVLQLFYFFYTHKNWPPGSALDKIRGD